MTINSDDILGVTQSVTKEWTKQRKAEERGRRSRGARIYIYSGRVNFSLRMGNVTKLSTAMGIVYRLAVDLGRRL